MKIIEISDFTNYQHSLSRSVAVIGTFDGIHHGHKILFQKARQIVNKLNLQLAIITFPMKVKSYFQGDHKLIYEYEQKYKILKEFNFDYLFNLKISNKITDLSPKIFSIFLKTKLNIQHIVVGEDFRFGKNGSGSIQDLRQHFSKNNFTYIKLEHKKNCSSSHIRHLLISKQLITAYQFLLQPIRHTGIIVSGHKLGVTINYPTINQIIHNKLILPWGIYVAWVEYNHKKYYGMACYWQKEGNDLLETYIFNFKKNIYGKTVTVTLIYFLRSILSIKNLEDLKTLIKQDKVSTLKFIKNNKAWQLPIKLNINDN